MRPMYLGRACAGVLESLRCLAMWAGLFLAFRVAHLLSCLLLASALLASAAVWGGKHVRGPAMAHLAPEEAAGLLGGVAVSHIDDAVG